MFLLCMGCARASSQESPAPASDAVSLAERGIQVGGAYTGDLLGNLSGGMRQGWVYQGKAELTVLADLERALGWNGVRLHLHGFNLHNTGRIRRDYVGGVNTIAAIEGEPATRLSELWLEQDFAGGTANLRYGQLAADVEFFHSATSVLFLQSDWATIAALNLPSGGPAYPLSVPGIRLKVDPGAESSLLVAVFNGNPARPGPGDEQQRNRHGVAFRSSDSMLLMAELQLRRHQGKTQAGLAHTLKLGMWSHRGSVDDLRFADDGRPLADPASSGRPASRTHNRGVYAVVDQQLYRPPGGDAEHGVTLFGRAAAAPSDRSTISLFIDGGIVFAGMLPARPDDRFGASFMISRFSAGATGADRDQIAFSGRPGRVRDCEANVELTYSARMPAQSTLQPTLAWVRHPNGDPARHAIVAGVRTIVRF